MKLRVSYSGWGAVSVANLGDRSPSAPKARRGVVKRTVNARLDSKIHALVACQSQRWEGMSLRPCLGKYLWTGFHRIKSISKTILASYSGLTPNVTILSYDFFTDTERSTCYSRPSFANTYRMYLTETKRPSSPFTRENFNLLIW